MTEYDAAELAFELGAGLRGLREERGWSQSSLAEAARTTQPVVARLEAGGAVPTVAVLQRLARALGVRLEVSLQEPAVEEVSPGEPQVEEVSPGEPAFEEVSPGEPQVEEVSLGEPAVEEVSFRGKGA